MYRSSLSTIFSSSKFCFMRTCHTKDKPPGSHCFDLTLLLIGSAGLKNLYSLSQNQEIHFLKERKWDKCRPLTWVRQNGKRGQPTENSLRITLQQYIHHLRNASPQLVIEAEIQDQLNRLIVVPSVDIYVFIRYRSYTFEKSVFSERWH